MRAATALFQILPEKDSHREMRAKARDASAQAPLLLPVIIDVTTDFPANGARIPAGAS